MKTLNKIFNVLYCLGAAIVILGAWAKILHKPAANVILTIGLLTEATLFVFMGIQEWTAKSEEKVETDARHIASVPDLLNHVSDSRDLTEAVKETNQILRNVFKTK